MTEYTCLRKQVRGCDACRYEKIDGACNYDIMNEDDEQMGGNARLKPYGREKGHSVSEKTRKILSDKMKIICAKKRDLKKLHEHFEE